MYPGFLAHSAKTHSGLKSWRLKASPSATLTDRNILVNFLQLVIYLALVKSVHFKKTVAQISFLSKLWYFLFCFVLKVPQF